MHYLFRGWGVAVVGAIMAGNAWAVETGLQPVETVLARAANRSVAAKAEPSDGARLLRDIAQFRNASPQWAPATAATGWMALWDRARLLDPARVRNDVDAFDPVVNAPVGLRSVIAALPAPEAWPMIRAQAVTKAKSHPDDTSSLGLRLITEALAGDTTAMARSLTEFERLALAGAPEERDTKRAHVDTTRALAYKLYGTREEIAAGFRARVDAQLRQPYGFVEVPDLVGLIGATKAQAVLTEVLKKPVSLRMTEGQNTRILARKLALTHIQSLGKAQWGLIDGLGTAPLYEAMRQRFDPQPPNKNTQEDAAEDAQQGFDYLRQSADVYYFLDLVIAGRREDAERAMVRVTGRGTNLSVPKKAMAELVREGRNEAVYQYLAQLLERQPQLPAWDVYLEQAGYLGHSSQALALLDRLLARQNLPAYVRADLQAKRLDALLGADQLDKAAAGFRDLLATAPTREDKTVVERTTAAVRLAGLGRVLKQPELADTGFAFAQQALALPVTAQRNWRPEALQGLLAELRRQGRVAEAQAVALAELEREADPQYASVVAIMAEPSKRAALIELTGLYDAAGRSSDVLRLLDGVDTWAAQDLRELIAEKDSQGTPLGMMAARALKAGGQAAVARQIVLALLDRLPGHDPAYQLLVDLNPEQVLPELDRRYAQDPFEERPLIWKAAVLNMQRQYDEAEATARRAIAVDPSDGEQGAGDRMRAYAVLADVMQAKGNVKAAGDYRSAVSAIRLSEQADELRTLGLYQRAFALYRSALDQFADAYCIQSRLAVQLGKRGSREEAFKHYRRAFELMPDSFGRVESHCFGCESVFAGPAAQDMADKVFTTLMKQGSTKPQVPYMLGYLRMEQGRYDEAVALFRQAVAMDHQYLNAWKHLHELGEKTYIDASERDIARLKLYEFDPRQLHVRYTLDEVADLRALYRALSHDGIPAKAGADTDTLYPLANSARQRADALAKLPPEMRQQLEHFAALQESFSQQGASKAKPNLADHKLMQSVLQLMGERGRYDFED